uniref:Uncharacterized protein n=1 Tax=Anguilla anguilla TaxID=7936 RepID=A0A0E9QAU5_ANGAN
MNWCLSLGIGNTIEILLHLSHLSSLCDHI